MIAASWTANFATWNAFASWLSNSNFASMALGVLAPGALLVAYHLGKVRALHATAKLEADARSISCTT